MYKKKCPMCQNEFEHRHNQAITCSEKCRNKRINLKHGRERYVQGIPSGTIGAMSEMIVAVDLMKKGYSVFRALSPSSFCDLIASKDKKTFTVEVKTGYKSETGNVVYPKLQRGEDVNMWGIYCGSSNEVFYFDKNHKKINV